MKLRVNALAIVAVMAFFISGEVMATEEPKYTVLQRHDGIELRRYDRQIVAQTAVIGSQQAASQQGFKILADFIFGNNTAAEGSNKIAMTAPVILQKSQNKTASSEKINMTALVISQKTAKNEWQMQFIMPSQFTIETLPKPNNPNISIKQLPEKTFAVIGFSGLAGEDKVVKKTQELQSWLQQHHMKALSEPKLARYDPPWTLPFMRRNEVMIECEFEQQ
ncbi:MULTISPECIES: heme-binding protein [Psychrobacter]|uniref:SOUL family heme-binding protein n=1 Tax=Psychrobacter TaxID=497 RepID=UPI001C612333|nr:MULTISPECIES: heme-binding protein [Psychrobacter]